MRHARLSLSVAVLMIVGTSSLAVAEQDAKAKPSSITIIASPELIPAGTRCAVELKPESDEKQTVEVSYEGTVTGVSEKGLSLSISFERRCIRTKSPFANIPAFNRLTRNVGIGKPKAGETKIVTVPVEKIGTVRCAGTTSK